MPHLLTPPLDDIAPYCTDWRGRYKGEALCVVRPACTGELSQVVHVCAEAGLADGAAGRQHRAVRRCDAACRAAAKCWSACRA
jgi:FAD/FMN-containing dehydrogenase